MVMILIKAALLGLMILDAKLPKRAKKSATPKQDGEPENVGRDARQLLP
jgi:hypothetical protein